MAGKQFWQQTVTAHRYWQVLRIGDLELFMRQDGNEYQFAWRYQEKHLPPFHGDIERIERLPNDLAICERCAVKRGSSNELSLQPKTADKPYQVKPIDPVRLHPASRITLYVGTPIWLALLCDDLKKPLLELPTVKPMQSWVGRSTIEGTICYTTKTLAPSKREQAVERPHRLLTALELSNDGDESLIIDRLSLPLPYLSVLRVASGGLWSESVRFLLEDNDNDASIRPLHEPGPFTLLAPPRKSHRRGRLKTVFNLVME